MKSQFTSHDEAKKYLEDKGELKYWGREVSEYVYTLTVGVKVYHLLVHPNGKVRVIDERYK